MTIDPQNFIFLSDSSGKVGLDWGLSSDVISRYIEIDQTSSNNKLASSSALSVCVDFEHGGGNDSNRVHLIGKGDSLTNANYEIAEDGTGVYFAVSDGANTNKLYSSLGASSEARYKMVGTADANYLHFYVYDQTNDVLYIDRMDTDYSPFNTQDTESVFIFKSSYAANYNYGTVFDVQIFERAISETAARCFLLGGDPNNPILKLWLDDQTGNPVDSSIIVDKDQSPGTNNSMSWSSAGTERDGSRWL